MDQLRIPGPTPLPDNILQAMTKQMVDHRGVEFGEIMKKLTVNLKTMFQTKNDLFILTGSGSGGMEAAVVNMLSPGEKVLVVSIGSFGDRFAGIAKTFGANVTKLEVEWGKAADPAAVKKALDADPAITTVFVTHNETSTAVTNPLKEISAVVKSFDKLLIVDGVSSLGSLNFPVDEWNVDVAVSGSQKGWMAPPGVAMVSVSERAWQAHAKAKMPRYYWDFTRAKQYLELGQTPWTPAVTTIYAMAVSLDAMVKDGLPNIVARHARTGKAARDGVKALGLDLLADEKYASNTVTAIWGNHGIDIKKLRKMLREEYHVVLAGGQGKLDGQIFRIGHLGYVDVDDMKIVLAALKDALPKAGFVK